MYFISCGITTGPTAILHKDSTVVNWTIKEIEAKFGKMTVKRGKKHTFVGIDIEFMDNKTVKLSMEEYVQNALISM